MFLKKLLLTFAMVLLLTPEITFAKDLASNREGDVKGVKYEHDVPHTLRLGGFINRRLSQYYYPPVPGYAPVTPPGRPCCGKSTHIQDQEAQTHN